MIGKTYNSHKNLRCINIIFHVKIGGMVWYNLLIKVNWTIKGSEHNE